MYTHNDTDNMTMQLSNYWTCSSGSTVWWDV